MKAARTSSLLAAATLLAFSGCGAAPTASVPAASNPAPASGSDRDPAPSAATPSSSPSADRNRVRWNAALRQSGAWYAGPEARAMVESVIQYQTESGGWPKNTDFSDPPTEEFLEDRRLDHRAATIDNNATTTPLRFLAKRLASAPDDAQARAAFERGFDYLLAAQYENGGWPQYYPLQKGYYTHITYNDNAMVNVLTLLRDAAKGEAPYAFVDAERRARAAAAVARGIDCILRTQVKQDGQLTVWCAQHDETTLEPVWARNFEPPSLSGSESIGIAKFLLEIEAPSPEVIAAVEGAVAWFQRAKITGLRYETFTDAEGKKDRRVVPDPNAEPLWARFYELGTGRPIFIGRDKVIHYDYTEIERERRAGYAYYNSNAVSLLESNYPRWKKRLERAQAKAAKTASAPAR